VYSIFSCSSATKYFTSFALQKFLLMMALFFQKFLGTILGNLSVNFYGLHVLVASFTDPVLYTTPTEFHALIVEGFPIPVLAVNWNILGEAVSYVSLCH
jgi:hypothetical protein